MFILLILFLYFGLFLCSCFFLIINCTPIHAPTLQVYDQQNNQPFSQPDVQGEIPFSFRSADTPTEYEVCFRMNARSGYGTIPGNPIVPIEIQLTHTFDLFDDHKARDVKVKPIEAEFTRLEEVLRSVVQETSNLTKVLQSMRDTNGTHLFLFNCNFII